MLQNRSGNLIINFLTTRTDFSSKYISWFSRTTSSVEQRYVNDKILFLCERRLIVKPGNSKSNFFWFKKQKEFEKVNENIFRLEHVCGGRLPVFKIYVVNVAKCLKRKCF